MTNNERVKAYAAADAAIVAAWNAYVAAAYAADVALDAALVAARAADAALDAANVAAWVVACEARDNAWDAWYAL